MDTSDMDTSHNPPLHSANIVVIARLLAFTAGMAAIAMAATAADNAGALWAIILVMWGATQIERDTEVSPLIYGFVMALGYMIIGVICASVQDVQPLWAMLLVNFFSDDLVDVMHD
jgi:hypothetical protein